MRRSNSNRCAQSEATCAYAAQALAPSGVAAAEAHIAACPDCRRELATLRPVVDGFVAWPTDVLRPATSLQERLALRIGSRTQQLEIRPHIVCERSGRRDDADAHLQRQRPSGRVVRPQWRPAGILPHVGIVLDVEQLPRHCAEFLIRRHDPRALGERLPGDGHG